MTEPRGIYSTGSELDTQRQVIEWLVKMGFLILRINSGRAGSTRFVRWYAQEVIGARSAGVSDILALSPSGELWAFEIKRDYYSDVAPWQAEFMKAVISRGAHALVIWNVDMLVNYLGGVKAP